MAENVAKIRENIAQAAQSAGRRAEDILLCSVCKTRTSDAVRESAALPVDLFGENHMQELVEHFDCGAYLSKPVHFIGHLQTNKVKKVVGRASVIESADSLKLLLEISREAAKQGITQDILFEINIGGEESKTGASKDYLFPLIEESLNLACVRPLGLMTIPPAGAPADETRRYFSMVRELAAKANDAYRGSASFDILSMGMSGSYIEGIQEGATIVRIGTAIYGPRVYPQKN